MSSQQYEWACRKRAKGLCGQCGKRKLFAARCCKTCHVKLLAYRRKYYADPVTRAAHLLKLAEWRLANPNYARRYYLKNRKLKKRRT